jgi:hypothetical protein
MQGSCVQSKETVIHQIGEGLREAKVDTRPIGQTNAIRGGSQFKKIQVVFSEVEGSHVYPHGHS